MRTALALAVFTLVVLVFFSDVIFGDRVLLTYNPALDDPWYHYADQDQLNARSYRPDVLRTYLPRRVELSRSIREGRFPLWNPYIFCGTPFFADPQSRVLYPISLLLVPFDPLRAMGYDIAIHFFLAMVGMYLFLRKVGTSALGAVLGGFSYGFSSFFFTRMGHPTFVASASWLPFMFYGFELARRRERMGTVLLAVFLVMGYLAGFPQIFLLGVTALIVYAAWTTVEGAVRSGMHEITRNTRILVISGLLSALLVSVQLIPFAEFVRNSVGLGYGFEAMKKVYLWHPFLLTRGIVPNFFGNPADGTSWQVLFQQRVSHENMGFFVYCGIGGFILVCGSLAFIAGSLQIRVLLAILLASIGLGTSSLVLRAAYAVLPYIRFSQIDRVSVLTCFTMSALAGITLSMASRAKDPGVRKRFAAIVAVAIVIVLGASVTFFVMRETAAKAFLERAMRFPSVTWEKPGYSRVDEWLDGSGSSWLAFEMKQVGRAALYTALSGAILLLLALLRRGAHRLAGVLGLILVLCLLSDVGMVARGYYLTQPADVIGETEGIRFLRQALGRPGEWRAKRYHSKSRVLPSNTGQIFHIPFTGGRSTIVPNARSGSWRAAADAGKVVVGVRGKPRSVSPNTSNLACTRYLLSSSREPPVSPEEYSLIYDGDMRIYENPRALEKGVCVPKSEVTQGKVDGRDVLEVYQALAGPEVHRCGSVKISGYEPERVTLSVTADEACFLIIQDTFYPGWKAYVDGEQQDILRTDIGFRAIEVDPGEHSIIMRYRPASFRLGMLIAAIGLLASFLYAWKARFRNDRTGRFG